MAIMVDKKPEYKGEGRVWESFADNLHFDEKYRYDSHRGKRLDCHQYF